MHRGHCRKAAAVGMLAVCLLLAVPQTAEARMFEPQSHDRVASLVEQQQEVAFWERVWFTLSSTWSKVSVLIDPNG